MACEVDVPVGGHPYGEVQRTAGNADLVLRRDLGIWKVLEMVLCYPEITSAFTHTHYPDTLPVKT